MLIHKKGEIQMENDSISRMIFSSTIVSVIAIISIMICCLAALGYTSKITIEKEKIEVDSKQYFNQI